MEARPARRIAIRSGVCTTLAAVAEELLLGYFGGDKVIAEALPVLVAFMPPVGIGILLGLLAYTACLVIIANNRRNDRKKNQVTYDLAPLLEVLRKNEEGFNIKEEEKQRARLAWEKYRRWLPEDPNDAHLYAKLSRILAIVQMYGYKEGAKMIEDEFAQTGGTKGV